MGTLKSLWFSNKSSWRPVMGWNRAILTPRMIVQSCWTRPAAGFSARGWSCTLSCTIRTAQTSAWTVEAAGRKTRRGSKRWRSGRLGGQRSHNRLSPAVPHSYRAVHRKRVHEWSCPTVKNPARPRSLQIRDGLSRRLEIFNGKSYPRPTEPYTYTKCMLHVHWWKFWFAVCMVDGNTWLAYL